MNCIIVEDEKPAQRVLKQFIKEVPGLNLLGIFRTALDAQVIINKNGVDLIFLDINLPVISGITLLKTLTNPPMVIITTAYSEYALESFELDVTDYLLKPFSFERFLKATNKALRASREVVAQHVDSVNAKIEHVVINVDKTLHKIKLDELTYISSDKDYVVFHTINSNYMFIDSLKNWEEKLDVQHFKRVHKSFVVNLDFVNKLEGNTIHIHNQSLPLGRKYREGFLAQFKKSE